jgi:hypothetical protein
MKTNVYEDAGSCWNEPVSFVTVEHIKSCYDTSTWAVTIFGVRTDTASNTYCRAPGKFHSIIPHWGKKEYTLIIFHYIYIVTCSCSATNNLWVLDHLHRFIGSHTYPCNYAELTPVQDCHSTQPILYWGTRQGTRLTVEYELLRWFPAKNWFLN